MNYQDEGINNLLEGKEVIKPTGLYNIEDAEQYFNDVKNGTLKMGTALQVPPLDEYLRYKQGNFVVVHGLDNVGKSSLCWWLAVLANVHAGVKPLLYCTENREQQVAKAVIQYRTGMTLKQMNDLQYKKAIAWFKENFGILKTNEDLNINEFLDSAGEESSKHGYNMILGDPYNSFSVPSGVNGHEYHLECCNMIKKHCRITNNSIYMNIHPNTAAYRNIHRDGIFKGLVKPPTKGDIDGGAKFPAKADEYITLHRYTEHPSLWMETAIYVRKVKDTETGGKVTPMNKPVLLRLNRTGTGFVYDKHQISMETEDRTAITLVDPMENYYLFNQSKEVKQTEIKPNEIKPINNEVFKQSRVSDFEAEGKQEIELEPREAGF